jgi:transposase-like protein
MKKTHRIAPEIKTQVLGRIKNEGVSVMTAAKDHGISEATIYNWLGASAKGGPTLKEYVALKRENEQLLAIVGKLTVDRVLTQKNS